MVWTNDINPKLQLPENATRIWNYCVTEILNNAIDHSDAASISIEIKKSATTTEIAIYDSGVGISRHSGQGIFFSSRMVDNFYIFSRGTFFSHDIKREHDWLTHGESNLSQDRKRSDCLPGSRNSKPSCSTSKVSAQSVIHMLTKYFAFLQMLIQQSSCFR